MKKIYFLFALLLSFVGVTNVFAQDAEEVVLTINNTTGTWTASGSPAYANEYATFAQEPGITIRHTNRSGGHNNNMTFTNGNLTMYSAFSGTVSEDYWLIPTKGWYVSAISIDFYPLKHPNFAMNGVRVWANGDETGAQTSMNATDIAHYELTGIEYATEGYIPLTIAQLETGGNPIFAVAQQFTIKLTKMSELEVAEDDLIAAVTKYEPYIQEGSTPFVYGDGPGNYTEATVTAFEEAFYKCVNEDSWEAKTPEYINGLIDALNQAYQNVLDSKLPMSLADGYYRFRTGINYNDGTEKYMYSELSGDQTIVKWGTLEDLGTNCPSLFKVTNKDGVYDIVNMSNDFRFNNVTGNPVTMSSTSTNLMVMEPITTIDGVTYVNIRTNSQDPAKNKYIYLHQAGHSSGAGSGGNLTAWEPSYPAGTSNSMGGSEWAIVPVPEATANDILEKYAPIKEKTILLNNYRLLKAEVKDALAQAKDIQEYTELITNASQFSSPFSDSEEGTSFEALIDNTPSTYWHSDWHPSGAALPNHTHYLQVELNEPVHNLIQLQITRRPSQNDHITLWGVYGANSQDVPDVLYTEDEAAAYNEEHSLSPGDEGYVSAGDVKIPGTPADWVELASLATPFGNNTETKVSDEFDTQGFKYLRFWIDGTSSNRGYGHVSEFQLLLPVPNPKSQYAYMGEVATNLDALYHQLAKNADENITKDQYESLVAAYDAFKGQFVDPTELRELLVEVEAIANGVVVGTEPGYWTSSTEGDALKQTYQDAKAYDADGIYVANKSNEFIETLKSQTEAVKNAVIGIKENTWYRISFGSAEEFVARGWDLVAGEEVKATDVDQTVTDEALWGKFVTLAKSGSEKTTVTYEGDDPSTTDTEETSYTREITINQVLPFNMEEDLYTRGGGLYVDSDEDIEDKDLSMFRFVNVGDTAYVLQNKATGLYVKAAGGSGAVKLDFVPTLFSVQAIGYGQNLIAAKNLLTNAKENYLHIQRSGNNVVTWDATAPGSRSGLYITEAGDATAYEAPAFRDSVHVGEIYTRCYPISLWLDEEEEGIAMYTVNSLTVNNGEAEITFGPIEKVDAGRPYILIAGSPNDYVWVDDDPETEADETQRPVKKDVKFHHGDDFVTKAQDTNVLKGTFTQKEIDGGYIVSGGALLDVLGQYATDQERNKFYATADAITDKVPAFNAYMGEGDKVALNAGVTITIKFDEEDAIANVVTEVAKGGAIYTIDGRLVSKHGNLNTLRRLGKGTYILNGKKVLVK